MIDYTSAANGQIVTFRAKRLHVRALMLRRMWIKSTVGEATDNLRVIADQIRSTVTDSGSEIAAQVQEAGELVTLAIVAIGTIAVAALIVACMAEAKTRG